MRKYLLSTYIHFLVIVFLFNLDVRGKARCEMFSVHCKY